VHRTGSRDSIGSTVLPTLYGSRVGKRRQETSMTPHVRPGRTGFRPSCALVAAVFVLIAATTGCGSSDKPEPPASAADTQAWCALVIKINTESGRMTDKTYLPERTVPPSSWKALVDAVVANTDDLLAVTPSEIKGAETRGLEWFARAKANHYDRSTPFGPFSSADREQVTDFQKTECGIRFSN
jgi:hypothetical protein